MKVRLNRFFTVITLIIFIGVLFSFPVSVQGEELLENGGFEKGIDGFCVDDVHFFNVTDENAQEGKYSCKIYNRNSTSESVKYDITNILKSYGYYEFSVYLMIDDIKFDFSLMRGYITVNTDKGVYTFSTGEEEIVNKAFTLCSGETCIKWEGNIVSAYFGVENVTEGEMCNFFVDGFSLKYKGEISATENTGRSEEFITGALRYDDISQSDASVLAYGIKKRALPYWFDFEKGEFSDYASVIAQDEIYASYAGINYFAYRPEDGTYIYHTGKINMCFAIGENTEISDISVLGEYFSSDMYQKYNGKNLVILTSDKNFDEKVREIKKVNLGTGTVILLISENSASYGQADLVAIKGKGGEDIGTVFSFEKKNWSKNTVTYASAGVAYGTDREKIAKHICVAHQEAQKGLNAMIFPWNDCKGGNYTVPVYKTDNGGRFTEENGEYLLDTTVIDLLHSELSGESISVKKTVKKPNGTADTTPVPETGAVLSGSTAPTGGSTGFEIESVPESTATDVIDVINELPEQTLNTENIKNASKEDGGETKEYINRNELRNIIVAVSVTAVLLGGAVTYKVITEKKKNEKKD